MTPITNPAHEEFLQMMPPDVAAHIWSDTFVPKLWPSEVAGVQKAVEKRRLEFAQGRHCARRVLAALGHDEVAVPIGPDRAPVWPSGVVGSITHTEGFVAAVGADASTVAGLGVDVERLRPLGSDVSQLVLTPDDAAIGSEPERGVLVFSAKESVHKTVQPATGEWLDFLDVSIVFDGPGSFAVAPATSRGERLDLLPKLRGAFRITPPFVMTVVHVPS